MSNTRFWRSVMALALPVAVQSLLYSLLAILNQLMVGQLGAVSVVAVSLASKNSGILNFTLMGLSGGLGILTSQLMGKGETGKIAKMQGMMLSAGLGLTAIFVAVSLFAPSWSMHLFTADPRVIRVGASYHRYLALSYLPFCLTTIYATVLRSSGQARLPLYAGMGSVVLNAALNFILIFGKWGAPRMGADGAALATTISLTVESLILLGVVYGRHLTGSYSFRTLRGFVSFDKDIRLLWLLTAPLLLEMVSFILADTVDNAIYGFMGTRETVAVTVMAPVQGLIISFFGGFATACSVLVGNALGRDEREQAYRTGVQVLWLGFVLSSLIGLMIAPLDSWYIGLYSLSSFSSSLSRLLIMIMLIILPVKIANMVITQGVLSAGGETRFVLWQSVIGSWIFAIPLGLVTAFIWHWSIVWVFAAISFEEYLRLAVCIWRMRQRHWLQNLVK